MFKVLGFTERKRVPLTLKLEHKANSKPHVSGLNRMSQAHVRRLDMRLSSHQVREDTMSDV